MMHGHAGMAHAHGHLRSSLDEDEALGRVYDRQVVRRLAGYLALYKPQTAIATATMLLGTISQVAVPWLIGRSIDQFITAGDLTGLTWSVLALAGVIGVGWGANYLHLIVMARISQQALYTMRTQLFDHLQRLSLSFYDRNETGRIMSRMQNDVTQLQDMLSIGVLGLGDLLTLLGIVVAMFFLDVQLALVTLSVLPLLVGIALYWQRHAERAFLRVRRAIALVNANLQENISGVRVIQSLGREEENVRRFREVNTSHLDANLQATRLSASLLPLVEVVGAVATALVIIFGGKQVLDGHLAVGVLVAFALYVQRFFEPIRNLTMQYTELQRAMVAGRRIFEVLDTRPELSDVPESTDLLRINGEVRFENVDFHYNPDVPVLQGINLRINPGETVALVGPTGAGKTTLASLIARFYDVTGGRITIDGHDVRAVTRRSLARQLGMVLQDPFLFSGTVRENIHYARPEATDEEVVRAAQAVGAHDFIMKLERGYDTILSERGANLSLGQRQLISFARAVLADPRILILDEATASVDAQSERLIQQALRRLLKGRTSVVIAHRLGTVREADRIVVLDQGRMVEEGRHEELLKRNGLYARLYAMNYPAQVG